MNQRSLFIGVSAAAIIAGFAYWQMQSPPAPTPPATPTAPGGPLADVTVPELSSNALLGQSMFETACASCHGVNAAGTDGVAPPLVHVIYEPNHHADEAFQRAPAFGVRSHHWPFGNMPAVEGLTRGDVAMIITYIRELQRANGIN